MFDAFTHVSQTVHDLAKSVNVLERRYQPALKLRLPYVFGPMNMLCPFFDSVSARSLYLLSIFSPRTKLKRRIHMGKEIHVHSEALKMEPRVEIYAIVTTIRVVLIKVRRESNNAPHRLSDGKWICLAPPESHRPFPIMVIMEWRLQSPNEPFPERPVIEASEKVR